MSASGGDVTLLLKAMHEGDASAADKLLPLIYTELRRLAASYMRGERPNHTLQPTALVNEAYLRLVDDSVDWRGREHFVAIAAKTMRRVLVDYARARNANVRGGDLERVELDEALAISKQSSDEVLALHDALDRLAEVNPRQAKVVELRYFGGLSVEEIANIMNLSPRSVKRDWAVARLWLFNQVQQLGGPSMADTEAPR